MKSKGILASLLLPAMLLTACTQQPAGGTTSGSTVSGDTSSAAEVSSNFNETGYPIVKEKITLTGFGNQNVTHKDWDELYCFNEYERISNIHIEWTTAPNEGYQEKKNVLLASSDYPDIFYRAGLKVSDLVNYGSKGVFVPMNDLIDKYGTNITARISENPSVKKEITMPDGNIYSLPTITGENTRASRNWINSEWLKNVGMEMPTTLDELEAVLKAFKEKDANGNGDPNDELPYSDRVKGATVFTGLYSSFGIGNLGAGGFADYIDADADGKIRLFAVSDNFKNHVTWLNKLYLQGLLDVEMFTQDIPTFTAKGEQNLIGAFFDNGSPEIIGAKNSASFSNAGPMAGADGKRVFNNMRSMCDLGSFAISKENKYLPETMRWVDYWYGEEGGLLIRLGQEGVTYVKNADGSYEMTDLIKKNPDGLNVPQAMGQYAIGFAGGGCPEYIFPQYEKARLLPIAFEAAEQDRPFIGVKDFINLSFTPEEQSRLNALSADIKTYIDESRIAFVTGKMPLSNWDKYVSTIEKMGREEYVKIFQSAYDRWCAA